MQTINLSGKLVLSKEVQDNYEKLVEFRDDLLSGNSLTKNSDCVAAFNAVTRLLSQMTKDLATAHSAERFAQAKAILIATLKEVDAEVASRYIAALKEKDL